MASERAHQIIDGYGQRFEVLCGKADWQTAHQDIRKVKDPCLDCLAMTELDEPSRK